MKSVALVLLLGALCAACSPPPVRLAQSDRSWHADDYDEALDNWTRADEDYVDFEGRILARATFLSADFRAAQLAYRTLTERLTRTDHEALAAEHAEGLAAGHTFFVAAHTHEWGWNHLERQPPKGLWRIRLVRNDGEALVPVAIQRLGGEAPEYTPLYPYYRDYYIGYLVRFPRTASGSEADFLGPGCRSFTLRISAPQGAVDLVWKVAPGGSP